MGQKERIEALKIVLLTIGFEYFKMEPEDRIIFIAAIKEYITKHF